jgi:hypothetical protein
MNRLMVQARLVGPTRYTPRVAARLRRKQWAARGGVVEHAWGARIDEAFRVFASNLQAVVPFVVPLADRLPPPRNGGVRWNPPVFGSVSDGEDAGASAEVFADKAEWLSTTDSVVSPPPGRRRFNAPSFSGDGGDAG